MKTESTVNTTAPQGVACTDLLGRVLLWLVTLSLIPQGWLIYGSMEDKAWARTIVGVINCTNGMAFLWMWQCWRMRRNRPNAPDEPHAKNL